MSSKVHARYGFVSLSGLRKILNDIEDSHSLPEILATRGSMTLELSEETLTDGSKVLNFDIRERE